MIPLRYMDEKGDMPAVMISPGQGTSAYYPEDTLQRDAVEALDGAFCYLDHPTTGEAKERPERSVKDLVGRWTVEGFKKDGPKGPGVYSKLHVIKPWRKFVDGIAELAGLSIRVPGERGERKIAGKKVITAERLIHTPLNSVDIVTVAGRGGAFVPLMESAAPGASLAEMWLQESGAQDGEAAARAFLEYALAQEAGDEKKESEDMELREALAEIERLKGVLQTATTENARLAEAVALRDASKIIGEIVHAESVKLPEASKARLCESLVLRTPMVEGKLDDAKLRQIVTEAITAERKYIDGVFTEVQGPSRVRMGDGGEGGAGDPFEAALAESYQRNGMTRDAALKEAQRVAAGGR